MIWGFTDAWTFTLPNQGNIRQRDIFQEELCCLCGGKEHVCEEWKEGSR